LQNSRSKSLNGSIPVRLHVISLEGPDHEWSQYAKDVETIIFCTSLSDYDRMKEGRVSFRSFTIQVLSLISTLGQNLLAESIELFGDIVNAECFSGAQVCIFMNKIDEFKEKIHRVRPRSIPGRHFQGLMVF